MQETDVGYYFKTVRCEWLELVVGGVNVDYKDTKHELGRWRMCSLAHGSQLCSSALWNVEHTTTGGQIEISVWGDVFLVWRWKRIVILLSLKNHETGVLTHSFCVNLRLFLSFIIRLIKSLIFIDLYFVKTFYFNPTMTQIDLLYRIVTIYFIKQ